LRLALAAALLAASSIAHSQGAPSARDTATQIVQRLAAGDIEAAAAQSNAPERRREVLESYRKQVGEEAFRRVYAQYLRGRIVEEIVVGSHRLVIWDIGHIAGQFFVEKDGRFVLDDAPSESRDKLRRALADYRKARASGGKD